MPEGTELLQPPPWVQVRYSRASESDAWPWLWDCLCTAYDIAASKETAVQEGRAHAMGCAKGQRRFQQGWTFPA